MAGFTKLFSSIVTSTIWQADDKTRIVWITMLATADKYGKVDGSIPGLAHLARVELADCEKALMNLAQPDPYSRTKEQQGRRIKEISGGWQILNYAKYRESGRSKERREYLKEKQKEHRERIREKQIAEAEAEAEYQPTSTNVNQCQPFYTIEQVKDACNLNGIPEGAAQSYFDQYNSQGWLKGNGQPITNVQSHAAKRWNKVKQCWDFDEKKKGRQKKLLPIPGKICEIKGCGMPAVYKSIGGDYDHYLCSEHMPSKVKDKYE